MKLNGQFRFGTFFPAWVSSHWNLISQNLTQSVNPISHSADSECSFCYDPHRILVSIPAEGRQRTSHLLYVNLRDTFSYNTIQHCKEHLPPGPGGENWTTIISSPSRAVWCTSENAWLNLPHTITSKDFIRSPQTRYFFYSESLTCEDCAAVCKTKGTKPSLVLSIFPLRCGPCSKLY